MPLLFATTLLVSAALLFWVQPMMGKMLLPYLGGTPAVWNTCLFFFQAMLLAGYAYAHVMSAWLGIRRQAAVHLLLLLATALVLPLGISELAIQSEFLQAHPILWLLGHLLLSVGLPFFTVSTTGPLLQKWFSTTAHPAARDPYFLYAASNVGSLAALLGYPLLLEPNFTLVHQSGLWAGMYGLLVVLIFFCAVVTWRIKLPSADAVNEVTSAAPQSQADAEEVATPLTGARRWRWIALAFVPSSLMLGVTTYLSTDIAAIPLLWVVPLALYLVTFVLVFARRELLSQRWLARALPVAAVSLLYLILSEATEPTWLLIAVHLLAFFLAAMMCHGRLAQDRPAPRYLTEFYLWMSFGGVLGGLFNALIAPLVFNTVQEYPLAMVLACFLCPAVTGPKAGGASRWLDLALPVGVALLTAMLIRFVTSGEQMPQQLRSAIIFGLPLIVCFTFSGRIHRFALGLGAVLLGSFFYHGVQGRTLHVERNFFGVCRVTLAGNGTLHRLVHGNTLHGQQFLEPARRCEPLAYYFRGGPLGDIFKAYEGKPASPHIAAVGLGAGSMACYAQPNQQWTFYEIDPAVIRLAQETNYFTFLRDCSPAKLDIVPGDARLRLREAPRQHYGLIVLDAFSSDAIPVHLLTRQAIELYFSKLAPGGFLAFHISNRCLDLEPVLGDLAKRAGWECRVADYEPGQDELQNGSQASQWVVMARRKEGLSGFVRRPQWMTVNVRAKPEVWTDDFSNLWRVFRWN